MPCESEIQYRRAKTRKATMPVKIIYVRVIDQKGRGILGKESEKENL